MKIARSGPISSFGLHGQYFLLNERPLGNAFDVVADSFPLYGFLDSCPTIFKVHEIFSIDDHFVPQRILNVLSKPSFTFSLVYNSFPCITKLDNRNCYCYSTGSPPMPIVVSQLQSIPSTEGREGYSDFSYFPTSKLLFVHFYLLYSLPDPSMVPSMPVILVPYSKHELPYRAVGSIHGAEQPAHSRIKHFEALRYQPAKNCEEESLFLDDQLVSSNNNHFITKGLLQ